MSIRPHEQVTRMVGRGTDDVVKLDRPWQCPIKTSASHAHRGAATRCCAASWRQATRDGTRAHNLLLRREAPYPLGHTSSCHLYFAQLRQLLRLAARSRNSGGSAVFQRWAPQFPLLDTETSLYHGLSPSPESVTHVAPAVDRQDHIHVSGQAAAAAGHHNATCICSSSV